MAKNDHQVEVSGTMEVHGDPGGWWNRLTRTSTGTRANLLTTIALVLILIALFVVVVRNYNLAGETHDALCTYQESLSAEIAQTEKILAERPELIEQFGFTSKEIAASLAQDKVRLNSLNELDC